MPTNINFKGNNRERRYLLDRAVYTIPERIKDELLAVYRDVDRELASVNPECGACGRCCDFASWDHQLWLTQLELGLIIDVCGLCRPSVEGICPYLEKGFCRAHSVRALGCRIFSCEVELDASQELYERYLDKIKRLARDAGLDLYYGELIKTLREIAILEV